MFVCVRTDVDECKAGLADCSVSEAECMNTAGGYFCQCKTGFSGDGQHCMGTTKHIQYIIYIKLQFRSSNLV